MSLANKGRDDSAIDLAYDPEERVYVCAKCSLSGDVDARLPHPQAALEHVAMHMVSGDSVPEYVGQTLQGDDEVWQYRKVEE
jgi:hypothetical protein